MMGILIGFIAAGCLGFVLGWYFTGHKYCIQLKGLEHLLEKYLVWVRLYDVWMMDDARGKSIDQYLKSKGIESIAIYGMSYLGVRLCKRLEQNGIIKVAYAIDHNPQIQLPEMKIYHPGKEKRSVDTVIVTSLYSYDAVRELLHQNGYKQIYAFDEILYDLLNDSDG